MKQKCFFFFSGKEYSETVFYQLMGFDTNLGTKLGWRSCMQSHFSSFAGSKIFQRAYNFLCERENLILPFVVQMGQSDRDAYGHFELLLNEN
jgi:hypothetical protein